MRIVQIIDSLAIGGAEKMAVNYANALSERIAFSGLVATRKEGELKNQIGAGVSYLFLDRKKTLDFRAIFRLKKYCKANAVDLIQAHSTSFFTAILLKVIYPKIKIIWHDHNGLRESVGFPKSVVLKTASFFFNGIIVVNYKLKKWAEKELNSKNVIYLPNFTSLGSTSISETRLNGQEGKRIVSLANLRHPKNHLFLLQIAEKVKNAHPEWTFHLIGNDYKDDYSRKIHQEIQNKNLTKNVFIYGSRNDIASILNQSDIAILTSQSEGLPVSLIEYGLSKKPLVSTNVGEIPLMIKNGQNGFITTCTDAELFEQRISELITDNGLRYKIGNALYRTIFENHSEESVMLDYLKWLQDER